MLQRAFLYYPVLSRRTQLHVGFNDWDVEQQHEHDLHRGEANHQVYGYIGIYRNNFTYALDRINMNPKFYYWYNKVGVFV